METFENADFISNFSIKYFETEESYKEHLQKLKGQYFLQDDLKKMGEKAKEIIRLMHADAIRKILTDNGIKIKGFASENKIKASKNTTSTYAHPLPKGYRRSDSEEKKGCKEAKIVFIGELFHLGGTNTNKSVVIPSIKIHYHSKHNIMYSSDVETLIRESATRRAFEDVYKKNSNLLVPIEDTIDSSLVAKTSNKKKTK